MVVVRRFLSGVVVCIGVSSWDYWYTDAIGPGGKGFGEGQEERNSVIVPR